MSNTTSSQYQSAPWWPIGLLIAAFLAFALVVQVGSCNAKKAEETTKQQAAASSVPTYVTPVSAQRPWSFKTIEITGENGVALPLSAGWRGFTQGGAVTITTQSGQVFNDKPGIPTNLGTQPDGIYVFRADPIGSKRNMVIYNRW